MEFQLICYTMQNEPINNATVFGAPGPSESVTESCKWILAIDSFPLHRLRLRIYLILEQLPPPNTSDFGFSAISYQWKTTQENSRLNCF